MFRPVPVGESLAAMEKEQISSGQPEVSAGLPVEEVVIDLDATHEVAQRGQSILELSKETQLVQQDAAGADRPDHLGVS